MSHRSVVFVFRSAALGGVLACALATPATAESDSWQQRAPLPTPRRLLAAAAGHDGKIYTFGGCGSPCFAPPLHTSTTEERMVEVYDPDSNSWSPREPMPTIVFGAAAATMRDKIYLFGGFVTGSSTQVYDPENRTWTAGPPMPTPRHGLAAVALGDFIYVIGGSNGTSALATMEAYDPVHGTWQPLAPMRTARAFFGAAALDGKIYAIGGSPGCCGEGVTGTVEVYDPESNRWVQGTSLPTELQTSAVAAFAGKIYVLGGFIPARGTQDTTFEYDSAAAPGSAWTRRTPLPEGRGRDQAPAVVLRDGIHFVGGSTNCHCSALSHHDRYVPGGSPQLRIEKSGHPAEACPGETVTYTIELSNDGTGPVDGALVTDEVRGALHVSSWTCAPSASPVGSSCTTDPPQPGAPVKGHANLPVGGSVTYTLVGTLDVTTTLAQLSNVAEARLPETTTDEPADATSEAAKTLVRHDRLAITKTEVLVSDPSDADRVLYRIRTTNRCPIPLSVTTEDKLSAADLVDPKWCRGADCAPDRSGDLRDTVTVSAGGNVTYMASGVVCNCAPPPSPPNVATADAPGQDKVTAEAAVPLRGDARLEVTIAGPAMLGDTDGDGVPDAGCSGDYAITVKNLGPCTAPSVMLDVGPPLGLDLLSISAICPAGASCPLGNIAAGSSVTVTSRFEAAAGLQCPVAPQPITATASSLCSQAAAGAAAVTVPCDLAISKTDGLTEAAPGDCILYTIKVENLGCGDVVGATVTDVFPTDLATASWCRGETCVPTLPGPLVDTISLPRPSTSIDLNLNATYHVAGSISPDFVGRLSNTASVTFGDNIAADTRPANNVATDVTDVAPRPGVDAQCTGTPKFVAEGASVTFTFVLWNGGPAAQGDNPGDEFIDVLPAGLTLVSAVATSGAITILPADTVRWNGAIPVDGMVTIEVTATVDVGTIGMSFCNPATVFFDADGDGVNESSAPTDDRCHPCCFTVTGPAPIPTLSPLALAILALIAAGLAMARLRRPRG